MVKVTHEGDGDIIPVRRRNTEGVATDNISMTIPKELNQTINRIVVRDNKTRSRVIAELIQHGLASQEQAMSARKDTK